MKDSKAYTLKLLPCPCCGEASIMKEYECSNSPFFIARVECVGCFLTTEEFRANNKLGYHDAEQGLHMEKAMEAWNRRIE